VEAVVVVTNVAKILVGVTIGVGFGPNSGRLSSKPSSTGGI